MGNVTLSGSPTPIEETSQKRLSRKLIWWIFGILVTVCVLLVIVMAFSSDDQQRAANQKKKDDEIARVMRQSAGTPDDINKIKAEQEQAAREDRETRAAAERLRMAREKLTGEVMPEVKLSAKEVDQYAEIRDATPVETADDILNDMVVFPPRRADSAANSVPASQSSSLGYAPGAANEGLMTPEQMAQRAQRNTMGAQGRSMQFLAQAAGAGRSASPTQWSDALGGTAIKSPVAPVTAPSKFLLSEGVPISVVSTRMINSDLPGKMEARVTQDVYDSIANEHLLIPMGSRLVGPYNSEVIPGQDRVEGGFTRLIFPNGASIALDASGMADRLGQSGLEGDVNNHFIRQLALQFTVAGVAKAAKVDNASGGGVNVYAGGSTTSTAGQILTDTVSRYSNRYLNLNQKPTITIPEATLFNVIVARDLYLPPSVTVKPNPLFAEEVE